MIASVDISGAWCHYPLKYYSSIVEFSLRYLRRILRMSKRKSDSQTVAILKEAESGLPIKVSAENTILAARPFTCGVKNITVWRRQM